MKRVIAKALDAAAFIPYGDVIECRDDNERLLINEGLTERHHDLASLSVNDEGGRAGISVFRSTPVDLPFLVSQMECHPMGSQAFMPLSNNPYLVVVAPPGEFNAERIEVFLASGSQGVNYHPGTWHHYNLALNQGSDFIVIDRIGADENLVEVTLSADQQFYVELST